MDYREFAGNVVFAAPGSAIAASFAQGHQTGMIVINATDAEAFATKIAEFGQLVLDTEARMAEELEASDQALAESEEAPLEEAA